MLSDGGGGQGLAHLVISRIEVQTKLIKAPETSFVLGFFLVITGGLESVLAWPRVTDPGLES